MSNFPWIDDGRNKVWSEREVGDYESCVVKSYAMGLIHGGVKIPNPYSLTGANNLERVPDEAQDLNTTDLMSKAVYGTVLRKLSTGTIADAVTRVNVGLCLTGIGCPGKKWQAGAFQHEVFYVPTSANSGYLGDPMAPMGQSFELVASSVMVKWAKGAGPNDAREVKCDEFVPPPPPKMYTQAELDAAVDKAETEAGAAAAGAVAAASITEANKYR